MIGNWMVRGISEREKNDRILGEVRHKWGNDRTGDRIQIRKAGNEWYVFIMTTRKKDTMFQLQIEKKGTLQDISRTFKTERSALNFVMKWMESNP